MMEYPVVCLKCKMHLWQSHSPAYYIKAFLCFVVLRFRVPSKCNLKRDFATRTAPATATPVHREGVKFTTMPTRAALATDR